jgi:putative hydrolase of the HAD superfamily
MPRAVTFDCWNTLLIEHDWESAHGLRVDALAEAAREAGHAKPREVVAAAFDRGWSRHMELWVDGVATGAPHVAAWCLEDLGIGIEGPPFEHLVEHFQRASHTSRVTALDGARDTVERLAAAGVAMALICDTGLTPGSVVRTHLEREGLLAHLDATLFSDEVGVPKPDPRIFQAALDALEIPAGDTTHVGDLRRTDVAGARALAMGSVRISATHDDASDLPEADRVAASHEALQEILGVR